MQTKQMVPVEDLVLGLYVVELDRPWLETPFLFQGFPLNSSTEIEQLREHCDYVYVDPERSDATALKRLNATGPATPRKRGETGGAKIYKLPPRSRREVHNDVASAFGADSYPDESRFRELLRIARNVRERSRGFVDQVFQDIRLGRSVETNEARGLVRDMVASIAENASASLWLTNLKKRDEYTHIHCLNVCVLAIAFGRHLGLGRGELETLGLGALLHDVGKMRTPDEVLNKPGKLTDEEFRIIQQHPEEGYRIMSATGRIPVGALEIIRFHHERLSGRGYPLGLAGEQISLPVMISALADVYDAMTSDRVYRDGMPADKVLKIMFQQAKTEFGQELVEEFIRCIGIFPVGSLVELDTGAVAMVIASDRQARLRPVILMVRTPEGEAYEKRLVVNLAAMADDPDAPTWSIRRVIDPGTVEIDVAHLLSQELERAGIAR